MIKEVIKYDSSKIMTLLQLSTHFGLQMQRMTMLRSVSHEVCQAQSLPNLQRRGPHQEITNRCRIVVPVMTSVLPVLLVLISFEWAKYKADFSDSKMHSEHDTVHTAQMLTVMAGILIKHLWSRYWWPGRVKLEVCPLNSSLSSRLHNSTIAGIFTGNRYS